MMSTTGGIWGSRSGRGGLRRVRGEDEAALKRESPAANASKLKLPILLIHGKRDKRAPFEHAERLGQALEESGNPPEWLVESREGHGFYDEEARERMYTKL